MMLTGFLTNLGILAAEMTVISVVEVLVPLRAAIRADWPRVRPNLGLTAITVVMNIALNLVILAMLAWAQAHGVGLLNVLSTPWWVQVILVLVAMDFSFYMAHLLMHFVPPLWAVHRVHHCDVMVDVTTTVRQHPLEGLLRFAFIGIAGVAIGASPAVYAIYRTFSALNGLFEHSNIRLPLPIDRALSWLICTPAMHKAHHSRIEKETNTNFGNMSSWFDRLFGTFTPSERGLSVEFGLDGHDSHAHQSLAGLLAMPFRADPTPGKTVSHPSERHAAATPTT